MDRAKVFWFGLVLAQTACSSSPDAKTQVVRRPDSAPATPKVEAQGGVGGQDGASVAVGQAGLAGQAAAFGPLGLGCDVANPCGKGLTCFAAGADDFGTMSPPGGFCSKSCQTESDCTAIEPTAHCATLFHNDDGPVKICAPSCTLGDSSACGGREDLACWYIDSGPGTPVARACMPTCNNDDQCPAGTVCDGAYNLCSFLAPGGGLPLGSSCNPNSFSNLCAEGFCIELDGVQIGACTTTCRRGTFPQCGGDGEYSICGWVEPGDEAAGEADIGMCASTCACDADCAQGSHCVLHSDRTGMTMPGICTVGAEVGIASCVGA